MKYIFKKYYFSLKKYVYLESDQKVSLEKNIIIDEDFHFFNRKIKILIRVRRF